ncbi:hypothetical protein AX16_005211 [Volvariella volvacea WC 439]|nr:hypothetical protein AX16_005211 [Volvariella volvacea WC 439]
MGTLGSFPKAGMPVCTLPYTDLTSNTYNGQPFLPKLTEGLVCDENQGPCKLYLAVQNQNNSQLGPSPWLLRAQAQQDRTRVYGRLMKNLNVPPENPERRDTTNIPAWLNLPDQPPHINIDRHLDCMPSNSMKLEAVTHLDQLRNTRTSVPLETDPFVLERQLYGLNLQPTTHQGPFDDNHRRRDRVPMRPANKHTPDNQPNSSDFQKRAKNRSYRLEKENAQGKQLARRKEGTRDSISTLFR